MPESAFMWRMAGPRGTVYVILFDRIVAERKHVIDMGGSSEVAVYSYATPEVARFSALFRTEFREERGMELNRMWAVRDADLRDIGREIRALPVLREQNLHEHLEARAYDVIDAIAMNGEVLHGA